MAALRAAVPLLQLTADTTILQIEDDLIAMPAEEAAAYLSRHGIHARIDHVAPGRAATSDILLEEVRARRVDYVVMGGFGHARLIETILGGASRLMLTESPVPVLFVH